MNVSMKVVLVDGTDFDVDAQVVDFSGIRAALNDAMFSRSITPSMWSSVALTVVNNQPSPTLKQLAGE